MHFGDGIKDESGNYTHPITDLEVATHEFTHGVTAATSKLVYARESGALNEAISDIFASLEKIKEEAIWKENKIKEYYSDITDTVRLYIEERFGINALELTSDEIIHVFKSQVVDSESKAKLYQILTLSDFVKFAKQIPIEAEHTLTLNNAFDFIKGTMREEQSSTNTTVQ